MSKGVGSRRSIGSSRRAAPPPPMEPLVQESVSTVAPYEENLGLVVTKIQTILLGGYTCVVAVAVPFIQNDVVEDDWLIVTKSKHVVEIRCERNDATWLTPVCDYDIAEYSN